MSVTEGHTVVKQPGYAFSRRIVKLRTLAKLT